MRLRLFPADSITPAPQDRWPDSDLHLIDIVDRTQHAPFCAGVCELRASTPVCFHYDDEAVVCYLLEGEITLTENGEECTVRRGDTVFIPKEEGLTVFWSTSSYGRFFYVTYPHWRSSRM